MQVRDKISFGAIPYNKVKIEVFDRSAQKFVTQPATFVHLNYANKSDIKAVDTAANTWENATYIKKIATASHFMDVNEINVYALTKQMKGFEILNPEDILGFVEIRLNDSYNKALINYLQVKPEAINIHNKNKTYRHLGSSILTSLKKIYNNIGLDSSDDESIRAFYKNNGFIETFKRSCTFNWSANPLTKLKLYLDSTLSQIGI